MSFKEFEEKVKNDPEFGVSVDEEVQDLAVDASEIIESEAKATEYEQKVVGDQMEVEKYFEVNG